MDPVCLLASRDTVSSAPPRRQGKVSQFLSPQGRKASTKVSLAESPSEKTLTVI